MPRTPSDCALLWKAARPMRQAALAFAPDDLRTQWKALQQKSAVSALQSGLETISTSEAPLPERLQLAFAESQAILTQRTDLTKKLQAKLLHHIEIGTLLSFGFEAPRSVADAPLELEPTYWRGTCHWATDELKAESLHFVEIRLLSAQTAAQVLHEQFEQICPPQPAPKVGRPSITRDIQDAIQALVDNDRIDHSGSMKSHYPAIRDWLREFRPASLSGSNKPSDEAIRRVFSPVFKSPNKL